MTGLDVLAGALGPAVLASDAETHKNLFVAAVIVIGLLVNAVRAAGRKPAGKPLPSDSARRHPAPVPPEARTRVHIPRNAPKGGPAPRPSKPGRLERAPEMTTTGAAHASHHEHLADLAATAIRTEAHLGHLVSEKHPGAHPSSVAAKVRRASGRALLLATTVHAGDRVRSAYLWNAVLTRRAPLRARPPR